MQNFVPSLPETGSRQVDPFSFFIGHASIIPGFGGSTPSPDPRYCFHTAYQDVTPGRAVFHLTLRNPRATSGELNVRVMALPLGSDASVAAGILIQFDEPMGDELHRGVRFLAVEGVRYALYSFASGHTDLQADAVDVTLQEFGVASVRARPAAGDDAAPSARARGNFTHIVSAPRLILERATAPGPGYAQPMQAQQDAIGNVVGRWPHLAADTSDAPDLWAIGATLDTLDATGLIAPGSRGLLVDVASEGLVEALETAGCQLTVVTLALEDVDLLGLIEVDPDHDFAVVLATGRWQAPGGIEMLCERLMECLAQAGTAIMIIEISGDGEEAVFRNRMQQLSLFCIGQGHDVMQLAFPSGSGWFPARGTASRFIWIARK